MVLRVIVAVIGIFIVLVGLMEMILPDQLLALTNTLMRPNIVRLLGIVELVLGVVLIAAALRYRVGLTTFVLLMGTYLAVLSIALFAAPNSLIAMVRSVLLDASPSAQVAVLWISGVLRIFLGGALFWAAMRPPRAVGAVHAEHR